MADGVESLSIAGNLAKVGAGFKGGPGFGEMAPPPALDFGTDYPATVLEKYNQPEIPMPTPTDTWYGRKSSR